MGMYLIYTWKNGGDFPRQTCYIDPVAAARTEAHELWKETTKMACSGVVVQKLSTNSD